MVSHYKIPDGLFSQIITSIFECFGLPTLIKWHFVKVFEQHSFSGQFPNAIHTAQEKCIGGHNQGEGDIDPHPGS